MTADLLASRTPRRPAVPASRGGRPHLPAAWPFYGLVLGFPLWWALGFGAFVWQLFALPMLVHLVRRRRVRLPAGFGVWAVFLLWVLGSGLSLTNEHHVVLAYLYRLSLYLSATVLLLFLFNLPAGRLSTRAAVTTMAFFWLIVVLGGYAGLLLPNVSFTSLTEVLLPKSLAANTFVHSMVHPGFSDTSTLLGFAVPRPKAPFNYTNEWGANLALLTPFYLVALGWLRRRWQQALGAAVLVLAAVPIVESLNRGLWLSLGVAGGYLAVRWALRGNVRALVIGGVAVAIGLVILVFSPLGTVVNDRLFVTKANTQDRAALYQSATESALSSPLLGHGAPQPNTSNTTGPSVGTHGELWTLAVSQGVPGALLFIGFLGYQVGRSRRCSTRMLWLHAVVLIGLIQLPFYNSLPAQLHIVMVAVVLCQRDLAARGRGQPVGRRPGQLPAPLRALPVGAGSRA